LPCALGVDHDGVAAPESPKSEIEGLEPGFLDNLDQYFMDDNLFAEFD
jgi:hypothetical protein